jgi:hypothetical protein
MAVLGIQEAIKMAERGNNYERSKMDRRAHRAAIAANDSYWHNFYLLVTFNRTCYIQTSA